jgi:hypothetical protein
MSCEFKRDIYYTKKKVKHTKTLCDLSDTPCIIETGRCERQEWATGKGITAEYLKARKAEDKKKAEDKNRRGGC